MDLLTVTRLASTSRGPRMNSCRCSTVLNYFGLARLRTGVSVAAATADLDALQHTISANLPADEKATLSVMLTPFQEQPKTADYPASSCCRLVAGGMRERYEPVAGARGRAEAANGSGVGTWR